MKTIKLQDPIRLGDLVVRAVVVGRLDFADLVEWSSLPREPQDNKAFGLFAKFTGQDVAVIEALSAQDMQAVADAILAATDEVIEELARPAGPAPMRRLN